MPTARSRRPTLLDVAKSAGVSLGSASRVMHAPESVRVRTRNAVEQAAAELGYVPDGRARALAFGRSLMVGVVLPTINNPVYAEFAHVLQRRLSAKGYSLVVQAHEYDVAAEIAQVRALAGRGVDGLILVGADHDPAIDTLLEACSIPRLIVWSAAENTATGCIGFSNHTAMRQLAEHLISLGHRHIGLISGSLRDNERARGRLSGVGEAMVAAGLGVPVVTHQPFTVAGGRSGLTELLAIAPDRTAIICTTDLTAIGALAEAREREIDVPSQLTITGFDDIEFAAVTDPPLTTVRAPIVEMAEAAVDAIVNRMASGEQCPSLTFATQLILRGSSAPPATTR